MVTASSTPRQRQKVAALMSWPFPTLAYIACAAMSPATRSAAAAKLRAAVVRAILQEPQAPTWGYFAALISAPTLRPWPVARPIAWPRIQRLAATWRGFANALRRVDPYGQLMAAVLLPPPAAARLRHVRYALMLPQGSVLSNLQASAASSLPEQASLRWCQRLRSRLSIQQLELALHNCMLPLKRCLWCQHQRPSRQHQVPMLLQHLCRQLA